MKTFWSEPELNLTRWKFAQCRGKHVDFVWVCRFCLEMFPTGRRPAPLYILEDHGRLWQSNYTIVKNTTTIPFTLSFPSTTCPHSFLQLHGQWINDDDVLERLGGLGSPLPPHAPIWSFWSMWSFGFQKKSQSVCLAYCAPNEILPVVCLAYRARRWRLAPADLRVR